MRKPSNLSDLATLAVRRNSCEPTSANDRGSVTVEYAVILVVVALACALATVALGVPLMGMFTTQQTWLELGFP